MMGWKKAGVFSFLSTLKLVVTKQRLFLAGTLLEYLLVSILFFVLTLFYTDFVLLHGTHQLFIEGPGDGTAGFLWFNFADTDWNPIFGHTDLVNYPTGENLASPTFVTYSALLGPLWLLTKFFGAIMALNIVTFFGFFGCAMSMYWLMKKLTGSITVALFAGFAAAYVPYHIMKSSSHLAYIFSMVFVLILAAFIGLWNKQSLKRAAILAVTIALAFYTDGYYLLLASVFVGCLVLGGLIYSVILRDGAARLIARLKYFSLAALMLVILMLPVIYTQVAHGSDIKNTLGRARDNIAFEIEFYAAKPMDYIIPSVHNPFLAGSANFQALQQYKNSRSNASENTLYIGFTLILLCLIGFTMAAVYAMWRKRSSLRLLTVSTRHQFLLITTLAAITVPVLTLWTLSPHISILGHTVTTPGGFLIDHHIALWRVLARFFLPLHITIVVLASFSLAVLLKLIRMPYKQYLSIGLVVVLTVALGVEYASATSRPAYDFNHTPAAYTWLRNQKDIQVVAELPLLDKPLDVNYNFVTAQIIHGKKLINTHLANNPVGGRTALGDEDEGEAVDYAIARGAQAIITHNTPCHEISWGKLAYKDFTSQSHTKEAQYYGSPICVYRVNANMYPDDMFVNLTPGTFADAPIIPVRTNHEYSVIYGGRGELTVKDQFGARTSGIAALSAKIQSTPGAPSFTGTWKVTQGDKVISTGIIGGDLYAVVDASAPVAITVTDLNGHDPQLYQVALSDIRVTGQ